jgi:hypothetical protein
MQFSNKLCTKSLVARFLNLLDIAILPKSLGFSKKLPGETDNEKLDGLTCKKDFFVKKKLMTVNNFKFVYRKKRLF